MILENLGVVPGQLGAALFRALADIPGQAVYPGTRDYLGRIGTAVGWDWGGERWELVFNPTTYQFMGEQAIALPGNRPGDPAGTWETGMALITVGIVDHAPAYSDRTAFEPILWQSFASGVPTTR